MKQKLITRKTKLGEILKQYPAAARLLMEKYRLGCVGCFAAALETLEEGARVHGLSEAEIEQLLKDLNQLASQRGEKKRKKKVNQ